MQIPVMNPISTVYAPNVHLFAFHVWDILASTSNPPANSPQPALPPTSNPPAHSPQTALPPTSNPAIDPEHLWYKCNEILQEKLRVPAEFNDRNLYKNQTSQPKGRRVNLIVKAEVNNRESLPFDKEIQHHNQQISLAGFAQMLRIGDSYALGFNIRVPEKTNGTKTPDVDLSIFQDLNPDNCLLRDSVNSYFGQTLLLTAWLSPDQKQKAEEDSQYLQSLAQQCLKNFISGQDLPEFYREGELFGSPILEYGNPSYPNAGDHILIWFFSSATTGEIWDSRYSDFLDLFLYRNKTIQAYQESRAYYYQIRQEYEKITEDINETFRYLQRDTAPQRQLKGTGLKPEELEYLERKTIEIPPRAVNYAGLLMDLEMRQNTIAINTKNYQDKLNQISLDIKARKKYNDRECDLKFLELFSQETCPQFQEQIKADLGYFRHSTGLLDKAMEAIRGVVAIEEAYRDAKLEVTIQAVGFGLGVAGVVASGAPYLIKQDAPDRKFYLPLLTSVEIHPFVLVLLISLGAGGAVWLMFMFGVKFKNLLGKIKKQLPPFR